MTSVNNHHFHPDLVMCLGLLKPLPQVCSGPCKHPACLQPCSDWKASWLTFGHLSGIRICYVTHCVSIVLMLSHSKLDFQEVLLWPNKHRTLRNHLGLNWAAATDGTAWMILSHPSWCGLRWHLPSWGAGTHQIFDCSSRFTDQAAAFRPKNLLFGALNVQSAAECPSAPPENDNQISWVETQQHKSSLKEIIYVFELNVTEKSTFSVNVGVPQG